MYNELFWHFSDSINETKRKYIIKLMEQNQGEKATIMTPDGPKADESKRNVKVSTLNQDNELSIDTAHMVSIANHRANWKYKIDFQEPFQYLTYDEGGHYVPHVDGNLDQVYEWDDEQKNMSVSKIADAYQLGKIRKISTVHLLNDDFEGGEFVMYRLNIKDGRVIAEELTVPLKAGDCLVFPSCIMHTVKPVTKGKRHSVVSWFGGERIG